MQEIIDKLEYNPDTGIFKWRIDVSKRIKTGSVAGSDSHGYIDIVYKRKHYLAHRLAWFIMTGEIPYIIDHINRDKKDNRIANLRNVDQSINNLNKPRNKGVRKQRRRYEARIGKWRASYATEQEAIISYNNKKEELLA